MRTDRVALAPANLSRLKIASGIRVPFPPEDAQARIDLTKLPSIVHLPTSEGGIRDVIEPVLFRLGEDQVISVMDKPFPHARLDAMVLQAGRSPKTWIHELGRRERLVFLEVLAHFFEFVARAEARYGLGAALPRAAMNYDPWTVDRPGLQPLPRLHAHLYVIDSEVLGAIRRSVRAYGSVRSPLLRRQILDPVSFVGASALRDLHQHVELPPGVELRFASPTRLVRAGIPVGLNLRLASVAVLRSTEFARYLCELHSAMANAMADISESFTGSRTQAPSGTRHALRPKVQIAASIERLEWASSETKRGLHDIATWLRSAAPRLLREDNLRAPRVLHHTSLNGLAYAIGWARRHPLGRGGDTEALDMNVVVRLFAESGGAGLFGAAGASAILLERGTGTMTPADLSRRRLFLTDYFADLRASGQGQSQAQDVKIPQASARGQDEDLLSRESLTHEFREL